MQALHGGKANNDTIDAQKIAGLLRGGMLPQAYVYPAARRATRDLRRRRFHLTRQRAERLTQVQQTTWQYNRPEIGKQLADKATRDGVAERCPAPAAQKSVEGARALIDDSDQLLSDVELAIVQTAKRHQAQTLYRLHSGPGSGKILRVVRLYEMHDLTRCPRGQDVVSDGRLVTWAKESAGQRDGTAGAKIGTTSLQGAFSEAAVRLLRNHPAAPQSLARLEPKQGKGTALTV